MQVIHGSISLLDDAEINKRVKPKFLFQVNNKTIHFIVFNSPIIAVLTGEYNVLQNLCTCEFDYCIRNN